jgi:hypothetical protein
MAFEDVARGDRKRLQDIYDLRAEVKLRNLAGHLPDPQRLILNREGLKLIANGFYGVPEAGIRPRAWHK